jgi:hypothetical protein
LPDGWVLDDATAVAVDSQGDPQAVVARQQFAAHSDKTVRAQSMRGRMALDWLYVPVGASWLADFRAELLKLPRRPQRRSGRRDWPRRPIARHDGEAGEAEVGGAACARPRSPVSNLACFGYRTGCWRPG